MDDAPKQVMGPPSQPLQASTRGWMAFAARWAVSLTLVVLALAFIDVGESLRAIAGAAPLLLLAGLALSFSGTVWLPAVITRLASQVQDRPLSLGRLFEINLTNRFYILVLPRAAAVAIRWYRYGEGRLGAPALALMLFERGIQLAALMLLSLVAIVLDSAALGSLYLPFTLASAAGTALALLLLLPFASAAAERWANSLLRLAGRVFPAGLVPQLSRLVSAAAVFRTLPRGPALAMMGWSLVATLLFYGSAWFAARAIGLEISLLSLVWIRSLVFLMTLVPITVGGIGVRELGFVGLLGLIGFSEEPALAFSAVNFAFQVAIALAGAAWEGWRVLRRSRAKDNRVLPC